MYGSQTATLSVTPSGNPPYTYRWRRNGTDLANGPSVGGGTISGATAATLTITNVGVADGDARYSCLVSNACGSTASIAAMLTVDPRCPADFDNDGFVTGIDFDLYVQAFEAGDMSADFDEDGFISGVDFDLFVAAFETFCG